MSYFELKPMTKEELIVNSIKNIYSVKLDDYLADPSIGVFAKIDITYKNINDEIKNERFTSDQKEFDILIRKIYNYIELNNIKIVSSIPVVWTNSTFQKAYTDDKVEMDDNTKKIFENNLAFERSFQPSQFRNKPYYKEDNLFPIDYVKLYLPIVFQGLKELYNLKYTNLQFDYSNLTISDTINKYEVYCDVNGKRTSFILKQEIVKDRHFKCTITSNNKEILDNSFRPTEVEIKIKEDKIEIYLNLPAYGIHTKSIYCINESSLNQDFTLYQGNDIKAVKENTYPKVHIDEKYTNLIKAKESWFLLPWNAYIRKSIKRKEVDKGYNEKRREEIEYFNNFEDIFGYYRFTEDRYLGIKKESMIKFNYFLKRESMITIGVPLHNIEDIYEVQTYYDNENEKLYYMDLVEAEEGIKELDLEKMILIGIEDGFIERTDFFKRGKVYKKMKGGNNNGNI